MTHKNVKQLALAFLAGIIITVVLAGMIYFCELHHYHSLATLFFGFGIGVLLGTISIVTGILKI